MSRTVAPEKDGARAPRVSAFMQCVRWLLTARLRAAMRKVIATRELRLADGRRARWLAGDFARFHGEFHDACATLRPVAQLEELPSMGNRLMVDFAVMTVAAYRALLRCGVERAEAQRAVADIVWDVYAMLLRWTSLPFRLAFRDPGKRLRNTIRLLLRFPFDLSQPPGYAAEVWIDGGDIHTHFTHCPPQSFVRRVTGKLGDEGDLDAFRRSWCLYDWPGADLIAADGERGHYVRMQTLSHGDPVCDMCWAARAEH